VKRRIQGLSGNAGGELDVLEGTFLACVDRVFYRWHRERPFYAVRFSILEPEQHSGRSVRGRLYCTPRALWKLNWFLRDFGYDQDLLGRDEVDERALLGLRGVLRVSRTILNGRSFVNLDGFAPAQEWDEASGPVAITNHEAQHDL
jgi:hypothetical protein